jgi:raffinose/stachyose/melibiose transport system substrate-binding protein
MIRNTKIFSLLLLALVLVISACGKKESASNSPAASSNSDTQTGTQGERTLTVMLRPFPNEVEKRQWEDLAKAFESKNPGIKVKYETGDVMVETGKLTTLLNSGVTPPDTILMNAGPARVEVLTKSNLIDSMDHLYEKYEWKDKLLPFAYDMVSLKDSIYELPHMVDYIGMGVNTKILEEVGAKVPENADEFYDAMQKVKDGGYIPIALGARGGYASSWLFGQVLDAVAGTDKVRALFFGEAKWTDEPFVEALETFKKWVDEGIISKEAVSLTADDQKALFNQEKAAMVSNSPYSIAEYKSAGIDDRVITWTFPAFKEGLQPKPTGGVGFTWVMPKNAKNKDLVEIWLNFILDEYTEFLFKDPEATFIPATRKAFEVIPVSPMLGEMVAAIKGGSGYNPTVFIGNNTKEVYLQNLQGILGGLVSPQEAAKNIEEARLKDVAEGFKLK